MELVYTDTSFVPQGVIKNFTLDLAYGEDENDFELKMTTKDARAIGGAETLPYGSLIYVAGTEWGGVIDKKGVDNTGDVSMMTFYGRSWHGILENSILKPNSGADYLTVSGDANTVLQTLINRQGLGSIFSAGAKCGTEVSYQFPRYCDAYSGIRKMLASQNLRLAISKPFKSQCVLSAVPIKDWSQFDNNYYAFSMTHMENQVNHLVCLGQGELAARTVIDLYADAKGNISKTQTFKGLQEKAQVYDYSNAEDATELESSGREKFADLLESDEIDFNLTDNAGFAIGDKINAVSTEVNTSASATVGKIIVSVTETGIPSIQYSTEEG